MNVTKICSQCGHKKESHRHYPTLSVCLDCDEKDDLRSKAIHLYQPTTSDELKLITDLKLAEYEEAKRQWHATLIAESGLALNDMIRLTEFPDTTGTILDLKVRQDGVLECAVQYEDHQAVTLAKWLTRIDEKR